MNLFILVLSSLISFNCITVKYGASQIFNILTFFITSIVNIVSRLKQNQLLILN